MIIRALDGQHDFQFGKGLQTYLKNDNAIAENIQTRLLSFLNDCFFDSTAGIDWIRLLGNRASKEEIILNCRGIILQSYGVVRVNTILINSYDNRNLNLTYDINTIFTQRFSSSLINTLEAV